MYQPEPLDRVDNPNQLSKETTQVKHKLKLSYFQVKTFQVRLPLYSTTTIPDN